MKQKIFPYLIALSAFLVSGSAAFYSVYGIGKMFAGASLQVMIMAGSLEFAKIVIASLLHQYWGSINKLLRIYFMISVLILIGITSAGIYGFLSSAYQETAFKLENSKQEIELIEGDKKILQSEIENITRQINDKNKRIGSLSEIRTKQQGTQDNLINANKSTRSITSQIAGVESNIKTLDSELKVLNDSLSSKNRQIASKDVEIMKINSNKDIAQEIGPIKYIAGITGKSLSTVVNWYIIALMLVFDPLAIALVIAANFAFSKNSEPSKNKEEVNEEDKSEKNVSDLEISSADNKEKAINHEISDSNEFLDQSESTEYHIQGDLIENSNMENIILDPDEMDKSHVISSPEIKEDLTVVTSTRNGKFLGYKQDKIIAPKQAVDPTKLR